jgi:hypothetical protein
MYVYVCMYVWYSSRMMDQLNISLEMGQEVCTNNAYHEGRTGQGKARQARQAGRQKTKEVGEARYLPTSVHSIHPPWRIYFISGLLWHLALIQLRPWHERQPSMSYVVCTYVCMYVCMYVFVPSST